MDGVLEVKSEVGKATCFSFDLRLEPADHADMKSGQLHRRVVALADGQPVFRLLVVENNDNNRDLLATLLRSVGCQVREAVNGREAVEIWRQWRPDLIWMDIRMPLMDGYEATAIIRSEMGQTNSRKETKIIALTASVFEEDRLKVIEQGGDDFVRKPFRESEIFEMLHKHLGARFVFESEEEPTPTPQTGNLTDDKLASFLKKTPEDLLARLEEATELSDAALIDEAIKEIARVDERLAGELLKLAENYAYDKILSLVQKSRQTTVAKQDI